MRFNVSSAGACAIAVSLFVVVPPSLAAAQAVPATEAAVADGAERVERLDALAARLDAARVESNVPGVALAIVHGDEVIFARGFGVADLETGRPVTPETIFAVGSTTKAFTATLIAILGDDGRMDWDDPAVRFLPEFVLPIEAADGAPDAARTVIIRDLLAHRTGFARMGVLWATGAVPIDDVLRTATQAEPWAPFRSSFHYNNVMYLAAGEAAGRAAGSSWAELMHERLLGPVGMKDATLSIRDAQKDPRLALGYRWDADRADFRHLPMRNLDAIAPAGAINAHALDMAKWVRLQLGRGVFDGRRLVSAERLEETWTKQIDIAPEVGYGFGWMLHDWNGHRVIEHGGNIDGFAAQVGLLPDLDLGFVLLANITATPLQSMSLNTVWDALVVRPGAEAPADDADDAGASEDFDAFVGNYVANFGPFTDATFEVLVRNDQLAVDVPDQMVYLLEPPDAEGRRQFSLTDQIAVAFERDDAGNVLLMKMFQSGLTFELPREGVVTADEIDRVEIAPLLGSYRFEEVGADVDVVVQNGRLAVDIPGQMVFEMHPPDADGWRVFRASADLAARFVFEDDRVTTLVMRQSGHEMMLPRTGDPDGDLPSFDDLAARWDLDGRGVAVAAMKTFRIKGRVRFVHAGIRGTVTLTGQGIDRYRSELDLGRFGSANVSVDGARAASFSSFEPFEILTGDRLSTAQLGHPAAQFGDWRAFYDTIGVTGTDEVAGRVVVVLKAVRGELPPVTMYVDPETGDLLKAETVEIAPGIGGIPTTVVLTGHRDLHGIRLPAEVSMSNDFTGTVATELFAMDVGLAVPPDIFRLDRPPPE